MGAPKKAFRTAVGGYNKQDVNDYIAALINDYESSTAELTARITELEAPVDIGKGTQASDPELEKANNLIGEQNEAIESMRAELAELREQLAAKNSELSQAKEKLSFYADSDDKLRNYERVSAKLGDLMIEAASNADRIKADAESSAKQTISDAEKRERELKDKYDRLAVELEANYRRACEAIDRKLSEYAADGTHALVQTFSACSDELCEQLERSKAKLRAALSRNAELPAELVKMTAVSGSEESGSSVGQAD